MLYSLAALLGVLATSSASSRLVSEQVAAYRKLLGTDRLTADGFRKIFKYHDGDSVCAHACSRYLEKLIDDRDGMEWSRLEELINDIYGDAISEDPFQPQEVHLALTGSLSEMKVMWATMDGLQDPFVEYIAEDDTSGTWASQPATSDTYTVPQNWYPTFAGVIYEANMVNLVPGLRQQYHPPQQRLFLLLIPRAGTGPENHIRYFRRPGSISTHNMHAYSVILVSYLICHLI